MYRFADHLIPDNLTILEALSILDKQGLIANVLFVTDSKNKLIGTLTDGDIRRGLLAGISTAHLVNTVMKSQPRFLHENSISHQVISALKKDGIFFIPVINDQKEIVDILNLHEYRVKIPVDVVIMAGGNGHRLMPLTKDTPKPMLVVGTKPIIEHNIDHLIQFGINNLYISINYLGEQLIQYFGNGDDKKINIKYVKEDQPLGTIGSIKLITGFQSDAVLVMNSDLLTNIDIYKFYEEFMSMNADMAIAATTYQVDVPYAVLETDEENRIHSLKEKPRYSYYSNAGIYILKKEIIDYIPENSFYNVTDLIENLISLNKKVISFPIVGYWLDIGKPEDLAKAQRDVTQLLFNQSK